MTFRTEFLDLVCESKRFWIPLFYIEAILLVLGIVGYFASTPDSASHYVAIAGLAVLIPPFVCMSWFLKVCTDRPD